MTHDVAIGQGPHFERLEDRLLLSLVGVSLEYPRITYDSTGVVAYDAAAQTFTADSTPLLYRASATSLPVGVLAPSDFRVAIQVDNAGNLIGGTPGDDFALSGCIDLNNNHVVDGGDLWGTLTGEILQFGFSHETTTPTTDKYDFRFLVTGGTLASSFANKDIGVTMTSEHSSFGGTFDHNFSGGSKGTLGPIAANHGFPLPSSLSGFVYDDSADNDGVKQAGELGIADALLTLSGTDDLGRPVTLTTQTDGAGAYAFTNLRPGTYTVVEAQPAGYLDGKDAVGSVGGTLGDDVLSSIVLPGGTDAVHYDFGELKPASLAGFNYVDTNNDGVKDTGEAAIEGTTIALTGTDDLGQVVSLTDTTDSDGAYAFTNLRPGTYTVTETQPAAYLDGKDKQGTPGTGTAGNDVFAGITLAAGVNGQNNNFGELVPASLSGYVYDDTPDNNGLREGSETGLAGVALLLTGTNDLGNAVSLTATTQADGSYAFTDLRPGTYTVSETQPTGWLDGQDTQGNMAPIPGSAQTDLIGSISLSAGQTAVENDFGELKPASLAGFVYDDSANNDGIKQAGDAGIPNILVMLTGTDDLSQAVSLTAQTQADGSYAFTNLRPGTYTVTETQPAGYLDGIDTIGTPGGVTGNDVFSDVVLNASVNGVENNFGELKPATLSGYVYYDANNDGTFQNTESGIGGTTVSLTGTDDLGNPVDLSTTTDSSGAYSFTGLRPGMYSVTETQPAGYLDGGNDQLAAIVLEADGDSKDNNFPELLPASIAGYVYYDANNDGVFQATESGISGATVTLTWTDDLGNPVDLSTMTDGDGAYIFDNLRPGTYQIDEAQPAGYLDGKDTIGTPGGTTTNDRFANVVLGAGVSGTENNFGELLPASLAGNVYYDANNDGVFQATESGISGATVTLTWTDDLGNPVNLSTTTDAVGAYIFGDLRPGTYRLNETQPAGYLDGKDTIGTPGGTTTNDQFASIALNAGVNGVNNNFGELKPVIIAAIDVEKFVKVVQQSGGGCNTGGCGSDRDSGWQYGGCNTGGCGSDRDSGWQYGGCNPCGSQTYNCGTTDYGVDADTAPGPTATAGSQVVFTYIVTNPGPVALQNITLVDNDGTSISNPAPVTVTVGTVTYNVGDLNHNGLLDVGEAWRYTSSTVATAGLHQDVATVTGTPVGGTGTVTDSDAGNYTGTLVAGINIEKYVKVADQSGGCGDQTGGCGDKSGGCGDQTGDYWKGGCFSDWSGSDRDYGSGCGSERGYSSGYGASNYSGQCVQDGWTYYGDSDRSDFGCGGGRSTGPSATVGSKVTFTYVITDTGKTSLGSITLRDDNGTLTDSSDDFTPTAVTTSGGYNVGDANHNGLLDVGEVWKYTYTTVIAAAGQHSNTAKVTGTPVVWDRSGNVIVLGSNVTDQATAYWTGLAPKPGSLSGRVFLDCDNDGKVDCGEAGIGGVTIRLTGTDAGGNTLSIQTTTRSDGTYSFSNLAPGVYTIREIQPGAYVDGTDSIGSLGGTLGNDVISGIVVGSGQNGVSYNFGELEYGSLAGTVYIDANNDGRIDCKEVGIAGITMTLTGKTDLGVSVTRTATTDASGHYIFANLAAGIYTITEAQPTKYTDGKDSVGDLGGCLSNDRISNIDVNWCADGNGYNFGELAAKGGCR